MITADAVRAAVNDLPQREREYIERRFWRGEARNIPLERRALALLRAALADVADQGA